MAKTDFIIKGLEIPDGMEAVFDPKTNTLQFVKKYEYPKSWKEYCDSKHDKDYYFIDETSDIGCSICNNDIDINYDRNLLPSEEYAKAILALCQLLQLRDRWLEIYSKDNNLEKTWEPDWKNRFPKYCIRIIEDHTDSTDFSTHRHALSFPTSQMCDDFKSTFNELILTAKIIL